jgi:hypothetical protein
MLLSLVRAWAVWQLLPVLQKRVIAFEYLKLVIATEENVVPNGSMDTPLIPVLRY